MAGIATNSLSLRGVQVSCQCACSEQVDPPLAALPGQDAASISDTPDFVVSQTPAVGELPSEDEKVIQVDSPKNTRVRPRPERGIKHYIAELDRPLSGAPVRVGQVWHLQQEDVKSLVPATLSLYANGFEVRPDKDDLPVITVSWSPFSLVQACRLHSVQADAEMPWLRLFKVSVFHHGSAHYFAARNEDLEATMRARWVADVARALRALTTSVFPTFRITADPVPGVSCTATRLVAGYLLMCDNQDVALVYCELHAHWDNAAAFSVYEDEWCETRVLHATLAVHTCISERVGVDCSCFSIDGHHFTARTCAEKAFWLRAVSNVKVKLRHRAENPTPMELAYYRASVADSAKSIREPELAARALLAPREQPQRHKLGQPKSGSRSSETAKGPGEQPSLQAEEPPKEAQASDCVPAAPPKAKTGGPGQLFNLGNLSVNRPTAPIVVRESSAGAPLPDMPPPLPQDLPEHSAPYTALGQSGGDSDDVPAPKKPTAKGPKPKTAGYAPAAPAESSQTTPDWGN